MNDSLNDSLDENNTEVSADTQVLLGTIEGMMKIINAQAEIYNDTRKRLVEEHLRRPALSYVKADSFDIKPSQTGPDLKMLGQKLSLLGARIKQMNDEKAKAQEQTENAFKQLNTENSDLKDELSRLRKMMYSP